MWAKLIVQGTLLPMLIHSIFGCCWHHAHSEFNFPCVHSTRGSHGDQCQHSHVPAQCIEDTEPFVPLPRGQDKPCDDVCCVYLAAESVRIAFSFDLHAYATILNSSGFLYRGVPATTPTNACKNCCVFTALEHWLAQVGLSSELAPILHVMVIVTLSNVRIRDVVSEPSARISAPIFRRLPRCGLRVPVMITAEKAMPPDGF